VIFAGQFQIKSVGTRELFHTAETDHAQLVFQRTYPEREAGSVCA
jgi:hypothetical protein